jgi:redox-sensitive bicupin YhaK (pirin superfamily)
VQVISAGTGMAHGEYNPSPDEVVHFLQIWIEPHERGGEPGYEQKAFPESERRNALRLVVSPDGRDGSTTIRQDASIYATLLDPRRQVEHELAPGRAAWVHVAHGAIDLNGHPLDEGDGAAVQDEAKLTLAGRADAEVLVFDLP